MAPKTTTADDSVHLAPFRAAVGCLFPAITIAVAISATGCTSLTFPIATFKAPTSPDYQIMATGAQPAIAKSEEEYHRIRQAKSQNAVVLQVVGDRNPSRVLPLPTDGQSVYVSSLLEQTGVGKKLGHVQATLFRHSSDSIAGIPMDVRMTKNGEKVLPESDYALRPGDRLRVQEAPVLGMSGMLETMLGI